MPDAFDALCDRVRTLREGREDVHSASLVFLPGDDMGNRGFYKARVRVDGRPAVAVGPKGQKVPVVPGVHRIRVRFSTRCGLETEKARTILRSVEVGPGDRVVLVCGMDHEAARVMADHGARVMRWLTLWCLVSMAAMGTSCILFPMLQEAIALLVIRLRLNGIALQLAYLPVRSKGHAAAFASLVFYIGMVSYFRRSRQTFLALRSRYPSLFFVEPKGKRPLADDEFGS